jgi:hypothetical protein
MPLQDKNRPGRKVTARKIICTDTGQIFANVSDMAEHLGIATQTAYNIIRRKQVYHGRCYVYAQEGGVTNYGGRTEETNARGHNAENG